MIYIHALLLHIYSLICLICKNKLKQNNEVCISFVIVFFFSRIYWRTIFGSLCALLNFVNIVLSTIKILDVYVDRFITVLAQVKFSIAGYEMTRQLKTFWNRPTRTRTPPVCAAKPIFCSVRIAALARTLFCLDAACYSLAWISLEA